MRGAVSLPLWIKVTGQSVTRFQSGPALMRLAWFANVYGRWMAWKESIVTRIRASWAWRVGRVVKRRLAQRLARWRHAG